MKTAPSKPKSLARQLAGVYGTSERQIARWKREQAPLFSVADMTLYFATRRSVPAHLVGLSALRQRAMQKALDALGGGVSPAGRSPRGKVAADPEFLKSLPRGAQHALVRLQEEDARLYAEKEAQTDPLLRATVAKQWRDTLLALRHFENLVETDKRDSGETVTRAQVEQPITAITVWLHRGVENFLNGVCLKIAEAEKPEEVYAAIAGPLRRCLSQAVDAAYSDGKFPLWMKQAFERGL